MKRNLFLMVALLIVVAAAGVTFAFFTYTQTGANQNILQTGEIFLVLTGETTGISLSNAMPISDEVALTDVGASTAGAGDRKDYQFSLNCKNPSSKNVQYSIYLIEDATPEGLGEATRLDAKWIKFNLQRKVGEGSFEEVIETGRWDFWSGKNGGTPTRIYEGVFVKEQNTAINHTFNLRLWIADDIKVSDTDGNADYTTTEFNGSYQSLKIVVDAETVDGEGVTAAHPTSPQ